VLLPLLLLLLQVVRMGADNMLTIMERAIEAGHSVLVENMGETIDAVLNPVITRWVSGGERDIRTCHKAADTGMNKQASRQAHQKTCRRYTSSHLGEG
jgi:hypothetical protein